MVKELIAGTSSINIYSDNDTVPDKVKNFIAFSLNNIDTSSEDCYRDNNLDTGIFYNILNYNITLKFYGLNALQVVTPFQHIIKHNLKYHFTFNSTKITLANSIINNESYNDGGQVIECYSIDLTLASLYEYKFNQPFELLQMKKVPLNFFNNTNQPPTTTTAGN